MNAKEYWQLSAALDAAVQAKKDKALADGRYSEASIKWEEFFLEWAGSEEDLVLFINTMLQEKTKHGDFGDFSISPIPRHAINARVAATRLIGRAYARARSSQTGMELVKTNPMILQPIKPKIALSRRDKAIAALMDIYPHWSRQDVLAALRVGAVKAHKARQQWRSLVDEARAMRANKLASNQVSIDSILSQLSGLTPAERDKVLTALNR